MSSGKADKKLTPVEKQKKLCKALQHLYRENEFEGRSIAHAHDKIGHWFSVSDFLKCSNYRYASEDDFLNFLPMSGSDVAKVENCSDFLLQKRDDKYVVYHMPNGIKAAENASMDDGSSSVLEEKASEEQMEVEQAAGPHDTDTEGNPNKATNDEMVCDNDQVAIASLALDQNQAEPLVNVEEDISEQVLRAAERDKESNGDWMRSSSKGKNKTKKGNKDANIDSRGKYKGQSAAGGKNGAKQNTSNCSKGSPSRDNQSKDEWKPPVESVKKSKDKPKESKDQRRSESEESKSGSPAKSKADNVKPAQNNKSSDDRSAAGKSTRRDTDTDESPREPDTKKSKGKSNQNVPRVCNFLFAKDGLKEKEISTETDGSVKVSNILIGCRTGVETEEEFVEALTDGSIFECFMKDDAYFIKYNPPQAAAAPAPVNTKFTPVQSPRSGVNQQQSANRYQQQNSGGYQQQNAGGYQQQNAGGYQQRSQYRNTYNQRQPRESEEDIFLSRQMSYLLRHGAEKAHLHIASDGYMLVSELLSYKTLRQYTPNDVQRVVTNNNKQRFEIKLEASEMKVRANQGHTLEVKDLELQPILSGSGITSAVHGTYLNVLPHIMKSGLSCMKRNHIHLAKGEPGDSQVISGMRFDCEVIIYVDVEAAIQDGYEFFMSANGVILCAGNDEGILPKQYFSEILDRKTREKIPIS